MIRYSKSVIAAATIVLSALVFSCVDADSKFGNSMLPPEWGMKTEIDSTFTPKTYVFSTDSIPNLNRFVGYGTIGHNLQTAYPYVGSMIDPMVGRTSMQAFTNYIPMLSEYTSKIFGDGPVIDSLILWLHPIMHIGDTTAGTKFELFELNSGKFSPFKLHKTNFDITPYINDTALVNFTVKTPKSQRLKLPYKFAEKFLMTEGGLNNPYLIDTLFHEKLPGFYIKTNDVTSGEGCMYLFDMTNASLTLYYRNLQADTLANKTINFKVVDQNPSTNRTRYNSCFVMAQHDYTYANPTVGGVKVEQIGDNTVETEYGYVQGAGGLSTAVVIPKEQIDALKAKIESKGYNTAIIHAAELVFDVNERSEENYKRMFAGIGPYDTVSSLRFIKDYTPLYREDATLLMDGILNRSRGKYTMNITSHVQELLLGKKENYTIQLGPALDKNLATQHIDPMRSVLMGSASNRPPRLFITYTMIK